MRIGDDLIVIFKEHFDQGLVAALVIAKPLARIHTPLDESRNAVDAWLLKTENTAWILPDCKTKRMLF